MQTCKIKGWSFGNKIIHLWAIHHYKSFMKLWGSDANIGFYFARPNLRTHDACFGKWEFALYAGRFLIAIREKKPHIQYCNFFATGCGG